VDSGWLNHPSLCHPSPPTPRTTHSCLSLSLEQLSISGVKGEEFNVHLFECTQVKFQDRVTWISLLFVPEAGTNLLGRDLMSKLVIGIKVAKKNFEISLNLITVTISSQILPHVWTNQGNRGELQISPINIDIKTWSETHN
jgi:hypothetical protein